MPNNNKKYREGRRMTGDSVALPSIKNSEKVIRDTMASYATEWKAGTGSRTDAAPALRGTEAAFLFCWSETSAQYRAKPGERQGC